MENYTPRLAGAATFVSGPGPDALRTLAASPARESAASAAAAAAARWWDEVAAGQYDLRGPGRAL